MLHMKKITISVLKTLLLTVIFAAAIIVPTMIISVSPEVTARLTEDIQNNILKGLRTSIIVVP